MTRTTRGFTLATALALTSAFYAPSTFAQPQPLRNVTVQVSPPGAGGIASEIIVTPKEVELCHDNAAGNCAGKYHQVNWKISGLVPNRELRIFVKAGKGIRGAKARGKFGRLFPSDRSTNADGDLLSGYPDTNVLKSNNGRWRYRIMVIDTATGQVVASVDPLIVVKYGGG